MKNIEVQILNPDAIKDIENMIVKTAMLTQHGPQVQTLYDFMDMFCEGYSRKTLAKLCKLSHPTIRKFGTINIVVVGASRAFLEHITRHQVDVKFMSASLHYSNYSNKSQYMIPASLLGSSNYIEYCSGCQEAINAYDRICSNGHDVVAAGNIMPRAMRNTLIISANPFQWVHMCQQRTCCRNTEETRYVMRVIAKQLMQLSPEVFWDVFPECTRTKCPEGNMCCGKNVIDDTNQQIDEVLRWKLRS